MGAFAVGKLGDALSELLGAEEEGKGGVQEGWAKQADNAQLNRWRKRGLEIVGEVKQDFTKILVEEYRRLMRQVRITA